MQNYYTWTPQDHTGYQPQIQPQTQPTSGFYTVLVNGDAGANAYPVASGNAVLLMDFNSNKFWLKSTNANGIPQPLRCFDFKEEVQEIQNGSRNGVTRDEFTTLSNNVSSLTESVNKLLKDLGGSVNE